MNKSFSLVEKDHKLGVLDHGFVRLVDYMGNDLSIVRAARCSYDASWRAGEDTGSDNKLINYLYKHKHNTPFESVTFTFEVYAPIFVTRQWHRDRTWAYNELSGRYKELPEVFYVPEPANVGIQSSTNKQGRDINSEDVVLQRQDEISHYIESCKESFATYKLLLEQGWPRELARSVLPVSTYTHMFGTVNLRNLFAFMDLRSDSHAQYEIRAYSNAMIELIKPIVPVAVAAWENSKNA